MPTSATTSATTPADLAALLPALAQGLLALARRRGTLVAVKSADGRYHHADEAMATFLGHPVAELLGHTDAELLDGALATQLRSADQTALAHDGALESEHRFEWRGERREFAVLRLAVHHGADTWLCCLWQDMAPERAREARLDAALNQLEQEQRANVTLRREAGDQALRDAATGLSNRAHFEDQLRREVDLSTREHREFAMVFIELDPFDARVDGAEAQARIFEAMGRLLRGNTRAMDASCRLDDRRFAVLLSGVGLATAHSRMEGLRRQCATQIVVHGGRELGFSVSMGVASYPHTAHTQEEIHAACEAALAEARRRGGNSVALAAIRFDPA